MWLCRSKDISTGTNRQGGVVLCAVRSAYYPFVAGERFAHQCISGSVQLFQKLPGACWPTHEDHKIS